MGDRVMTYGDWYNTTLEMSVEHARWGLTAPEFEATAGEIVERLKKPE